MPAVIPGIAPTGRRVEVAVCVVVGFEDGKVAYERIYWDQASILVQIGLLDPGRCPSQGWSRRDAFWRQKKSLPTSSYGRRRLEPVFEGCSESALQPKSRFSGVSEGSANTSWPSPGQHTSAPTCIGLSASAKSRRFQIITVVEQKCPHSHLDPFKSGDPLSPKHSHRSEAYLRALNHGSANSPVST